ncbi:MAG: dTMP kinase, partial [Candidatus Omnitrophica bacterium]|nr:dTMP kinase [Candidatus Omnitrophota bacterium]MBD3269165.1 dTMP kinase [Candidatus Omnitrophota bacterium]
MKKRKAFFITVEGCEGSGKSSVIKFIQNFLSRGKYKVKTYREPGSTAVGEKIRKVLLDKNNQNLSPRTELLLYLAARTQLIETRLKKDLSNYDFIICDRFFDSTLVYQGYGLGLLSLTKKAIKMFSLGIKPDLTLVLDVPVEKGLGRVKAADRIEARSLRFHRRLRQGYSKLARSDPRRVKIIDA